LQIWQAVVLGLVEGITEYLPISSTGHLILASALMGLNTPDQKDAVDDFNIVIQGGAILAVLGLYWPRVRQMVRGLMGKDAAGFKLLMNLFIAFLPSAVIGLMINKWVKSQLFYPGPVLAAVLLGGIYMIAMDQWRTGRFGLRRFEGKEKDITELSPIDALLIGFMQTIAMWPGTSRSMMTITGGMLVGMRPRQAAEFSFLLGLPTLGAATLYDLFKNIKHAHETGGQNLFQQLGVLPVLVGIAVAAVSAAIAVKWLVAFLTKHGLTAFGVYRILLFAVLALFIWKGVLKIAPEPAQPKVSERVMVLPASSEVKSQILVDLAREPLRRRNICY
jgi:undecaprenyl-diphosphatase